MVGLLESPFHGGDIFFRSGGKGCQAGGNTLFKLSVGEIHQTVPVHQNIFQAMGVDIDQTGKNVAPRGVDRFFVRRSTNIGSNRLNNTSGDF